MNNQAKNTPLNSGSSFNYGYVIVAACFVIVLLNVGMFISIGVFFKPILTEFGWTRAITSGPLSISAIVTGLCSIVSGALCDRFGPRKVISACILIAGSGYLLMSQISEIWHLYLYFGLLTGIGSSSMVPMVSSIPRWFVQRRTVMVGIISAGGGVGGLFIPLVSAWLIEAFSWQTAYLILGSIYLAVAMLAAQLLRRSPRPTVATTSTAQTNLPESYGRDKPIKDTLKSAKFVLSMLMYFCFGASVLTVQFHIVNHATDIGLSPTAGAGVLSIVNGVSILGSILMGSLGDRFGNRTLFILAFAMVFCCMISLLFIDQQWQFTFFAVAFGMAFGAGLSNAPALVSRLFGVGLLGLILGMSSLCQTLGGSIGGFFAGYIYDIQNSYRLIFLICSVLCLVGITALTLLKSPTLTRGKPQSI